MSRRNQQQAEAAHPGLFATSYLRSVWTTDFESFRASGDAAALLSRLRRWANKDWQKETSSSGALVDVFFKQVWGYQASGEGLKEKGYTLQPEFPVDGAGARGGPGSADAALGFFGATTLEPVPQVLCEFKDDRTGLDQPQQGRPNSRTPVEQCFDYLREARRGRISTVLPTWAVVTDMNEFRLYIYGNRGSYQRYVISPTPGDQTISLIDDGDEAEFQRFLFSRVFHRDWLLSESGQSRLEKLLGAQLTFEKSLEKDFYREYQAFRTHLFATLDKENPTYREDGHLRRLVGITQRLLDRFIFILYCEDMGSELSFPPNALRDLLIDVSNGHIYNSDGNDAWFRVQALFRTMRDGGPFGESRIHRFNGGLFAHDPAIDSLNVPNHVFCAKNQGQSQARLFDAKTTLLYFSSRYNFGASDDDGERTLTLTALGRIFEQSITDLEVMEATADGRESLAEITKRKRDGVYYTPEWVTRFIVEETLGGRLAEIRKELGFDRFGGITDDDVIEHDNDGRKKPLVKAYRSAIELYSERLNGIKVVDPACGSGAFLIQAFQYLYKQRIWISAERERLNKTLGIFDIHSVMRDILSKNLYGVDINAESVEITRLALWLHTALPDRPLASLDENIRCGNSLVGVDFYSQFSRSIDMFPEDERDKVNVFDWKQSFPEVFEREAPGFDCVIGNPPYVKLQNFRRVHQSIAEYLASGCRQDGRPIYESTQTGNFDLYLPFIEKGIDLLRPNGKLGYIAPNAWIVNEYGAGLRKKVKRQGSLDRFIDFKSYQVFDEATTYTALQFFSGASVDAVKCVFAPRGMEDVVALDWTTESSDVGYSTLPVDSAWEFMPAEELALSAKLRISCIPLGEACEQIAVGVQTSADHIYHLERIAPGRYLKKSRGAFPAREVDIEDAVMLPLVSGTEAKRYAAPVTNTFILFPYAINEGRAELRTASAMEASFPKAWAYLLENERELRSREGGKFDDKVWYRFGRSQNLDKQHLAKILVPRLVLRLHATYDEEAACCLDNVDVNGILTADVDDAWFLLGLINGPVMNFIWRRTSKPFQNDFRAANKQFIAPLPTPKVNSVDKLALGAHARRLTELHTRRADLNRRIVRRLDGDQCEDDLRDEGWLWSEVKSVKRLQGLDGGFLTRRDAVEERERRLLRRIDGLDVLLQAGVSLCVASHDGELQVLANGVPAIEGVFLAPGEVDFVAAQWRHRLRQVNVSESFGGKRFVRQLLALRRTENKSLIDQVVALDEELQKLEVELAHVENEANQLVYRLYNLTSDEIRLVEAD